MRKHKNADYIMEQKTWTGADVGKVWANIQAIPIAIYRGIDLGTKLTDSDLATVAKTIDTVEDHIVYSAYGQIGAKLTEYASRTETLYFQLKSTLQELTLRLQAISDGENTSRKMLQLPLILTQEQYDSMCETVKQTKRKRTITTEEILFHLCQYFIFYPYDSPGTMQEELEQCRNEKATNEEAIDAYCGEYSTVFLDTGECIDDYSEGEWIKLLESKWHGGKLTLDEWVKARRERFSTAFLESPYRMERAYREVTGRRYNTAEHNGLTIEEYFETDLKEKNDKAYKVRALMQQPCIEIKPAKKERITPMLTKYGILEALGLLRENEHLYPKWKDFESDYPGIALSLKEYLKRKLKISRLPMTKKWTLEELSHNHVADFKAEIAPTYDDIAELCLTQYEEKARAKYRGISVIQGCGDWAIMPQTDTYETPQNILDDMKQIDSIDEDYIKATKHQNGTMVYSILRQLMCVNKVIDLITDEFDIPFMYVAKYPEDKILQEVNAYNDLLKQIYLNVTGDSKERKRKRKLIRNAFSLIDMEVYTPTNPYIKKVKGMLKEIDLKKAGGLPFRSLRPYVEVLYKGVD